MQVHKRASLVPKQKRAKQRWSILSMSIMGIAESWKQRFLFWISFSAMLEKFSKSILDIFSS